MQEIDYQRLEAAVSTEYLDDILKRAEGGDVKAANAALMTIGHMLSSQNLDPVSAEPLPVPTFLRDYLSRAFYRMCKGVPPATALNLKRPGRRNRGHIEKRLAAYLVYQGVHEHGQTILEASANAAAHINDKSVKNELTGQWSAFQGEKVEPETLQSWYYQFKDELDAMYEASQGVFLPPS